MKNNSFKNDVISLVDEIIINGINKRSSDIHLQYDETGVYIKYRIDGVLVDFSSNIFFDELNKNNKNEDIQKNQKNEKNIFNNIVNNVKKDNKYNIFYKYIIEIISRIKILSNMNVAEKRKPQDGSFSFLFNEENYDIRVAMLPLVKGECIVLRLLQGNKIENNLDKLGFLNESKLLIKKMISFDYGLILISGATGSGKSTTLMSIINELNNGDKKIITVEDPVEIKIKGITQVQVNEEIGVTFYSILKNTLRCDPDIIVISEIRDEITAEIAVRAALTGHLVISTIHTKDAISTVVRLIDMRIPKYLIIDCLIGVVSQKLFPKIGGGRNIVNEILYFDNYVKNCFKNNDDSLEIVKLLQKENKINESSEKAEGIKDFESKEKLTNNTQFSNKKTRYISFKEDLMEKINMGIISKKEMYRFDE